MIKINLNKLVTFPLTNNLASNQANEWVKEKIQANNQTTHFRVAVKDVLREYMLNWKWGPANCSEQLKQNISKWAKDAIESDMARICASNADVMVRELKAEILLAVPEAGEIRQETSASSATYQQAMLIIQKQIDEMGNKVNLVKSVSVDSSLEIALILAIFSNPKSAAAKALEWLKIWSELRPSRKEELEAAAKNLLNFQSTKGYLTLLDFNTAVFRCLTDQAQKTFKSLQTELQRAMNKNAHEIRMDSAE